MDIHIEGKVAPIKWYSFDEYQDFNNVTQDHPIRIGRNDVNLSVNVEELPEDLSRETYLQQWAMDIIRNTDPTQWKKDWQRNYRLQGIKANIDYKSRVAYVEFIYEYDLGESSTDEAFLYVMGAWYDDMCYKAVLEYSPKDVNTVEKMIIESLLRP